VSSPTFHKRDIFGYPRKRIAMDDVERWLKRAAEARDIAVTMTDPWMRSAMVEVVQIYQWLAARAETRRWEHTEKAS
jgi:hypothetical protein